MPTTDMLEENIEALRKDVGNLRVAVIRLEARIDAKPGYLEMLGGIVVLLFGMAGVITATIVTLHALSFFR